MGRGQAPSPYSTAFLSFGFKNYDNVRELVGACPINGTSNAMNRDF